MKDLRNPFGIRASEHIDSDTSFLRLFGPGVLDLLPADDLWKKTCIFRSAPGGGKTSLFRVFTPFSLLALHSSRDSGDDYKDLLDKMQELGVITTKGPQLLGIMLSCAKGYAILEDLNLEKPKKQRLFYALLNARLTIATLRGMLILRGLIFPNDLQKISIQVPKDLSVPISVPLPATAREVYDWACSIEKKVCELMDSFGAIDTRALEGLDSIQVTNFLTAENIFYKNTPMVGRIHIMLDDVHKLAAGQRKGLIENLCDLRQPSWLAERLEALSPNELLSSGAGSGRDYKEINLEDFWRKGNNSNRFKNAVMNIADRRTKSVYEFEIGSFAECLESSLEGNEWQDKLENAAESINKKLKERFSETKRYQEWIKVKEALNVGAHERAIEWRELEILIERDLRKYQMSFDFSLTSEDLEKKEASGIKAAADFFLSKEFKIPYYYGINRLAILASSNIEQFLGLAGELFEEIISLRLLRQRLLLTVERQNAILKKEARERWEDIPRRVPNGREVQKFLKNVAEFALAETNRPNAPYVPGVTGFGVTMLDRDELLNLATQEKNPEYKKIVNILSACISENLLEADLDRAQGQKNKAWMILYLNRWLCLHFGLPLGYGGWRAKSLKDLGELINKEKPKVGLL